MAKKFKIFMTATVGEANILFDSQSVKEQFFWDTLDKSMDALKAKTDGKSRNKQDTLGQIKDLLLNGNQVTVGELCFQIVGRD